MTSLADLTDTEINECLEIPSNIPGLFNLTITDIQDLLSNSNLLTETGRLDNSLFADAFTEKFKNLIEADPATIVYQGVLDFYKNVGFVIADRINTKILFKHNENLPTDQQITSLP